jgi:hypothetical protein
VRLPKKELIMLEQIGKFFLTLKLVFDLIMGTARELGQKL